MHALAIKQKEDATVDQTANVCLLESERELLTSQELLGIMASKILRSLITKESTWSCSSILLTSHLFAPLKSFSFQTELKNSEILDVRL